MARVNKKGLITLCFNAHLPFAKFAKSGEIFQERWFFEAMLESYLPIYRGFAQLVHEGTPFFVLISLSPTLMELLADEDLQTKFIFYLHQKLDIANKELERKRGSEEEQLIAFYVQETSEMLALYKKLGGDLLAALKNAQDLGYCEIITSAATMSFLPLYASYPYAVKAQVHAAVYQYREVFNRQPAGFFLPYGGYYSGLDAVLRAAGVKYFVSSGQSLVQAEPSAQMGVFYPVKSENGLVAFPRYSTIDAELWDEDGIAMRGCYRNFYQEEGQKAVVIKAGLKDYPSFFSDDVVHLEGFKCTSNDDELYDFEAAFARAREDGRAFAKRRISELEQFENEQNRAGLLLLVADLELFGHHWFEGVEFIKEFYRTIDIEMSIEIILPTLFMRRNYLLEQVELGFASWGESGYAQVWLDQHNDWLVKYIFRAIEQMNDLAVRFADESGLKKRVLDQAAKEVLLAMAGDWPLQISQRVNEKVALRQLQKHLLNFNEIYEAMSRNVVRALWLTEMEREHGLFKAKRFTYKLFNDDLG